ncbi:DUF1800 domain-containing protein [Thiolapillus sp.]
MPDQTRRKFLFSALSSATLASGAGVASVMMDAPASNARKMALFDGKIQAAARQAQATAIPPFANVVLDRMGFGPRGSDIADFNALGGNDDARLQAYVEQQLNWSGIADTELEARIAGAGYTTLNKPLSQLWQEHRVDRTSGYYEPLDEIERLAFLRAVYSKRQLLEFLADFWHNHFNIYGRDTYAAPTWTSWDRDVIRPPVNGSSRPAGLENGHLMGNFRQMLELSAKHPAMVYYLDNYVNGRADPNENYAREIIELHTLGSINYAGPDPQPGDIATISNSDFPGGFNDKYSDADVYEAMRFLTGWNVKDGRSPSGVGEENTGEWYFWPDWHDGGQKQLLGVHWPAYSGISEVYEMLDLLAYHPGTAEHIALKLCTRFLNDTPPQSLVDKVKQTFYDARHDPDQLEQTYRTLLLSDEFKDTSTWGSKLKRPFEVVVSALRACDGNFTVRPDDTESRYLTYYMQRTGQRPFYWRGPDGYPDKRSFWEGGASLINTWRTLDWLVDENVGRDDPDLMPVTEITAAANLAEYTPNSLAEFWLKQILKWEPPGGWIGTPLHGVLSEFMSTRPDDDPSPWPADYPIPPEDIGRNSYPYYWNERVRGLVKLIFATPEFMQR